MTADQIDRVREMAHSSELWAKQSRELPFSEPGDGDESEADALALRALLAAVERGESQIRGLEKAVTQIARENRSLEKRLNQPEQGDAVRVLEEARAGVDALRCTVEVRRLHRAIRVALRLLRRPVGQHHPHAGEAVKVLERAIQPRLRKDEKER